MTGATLDSRVEAVHQRLGPRALDVMFHAVGVAVTASGLAIALLTLAYVEATPGEAAVTLLGFPALAGGVTWLVGGRLWRRAMAPLQAWLEGARDDDATRAAWARALSFSYWIWSSGLALGVTAVVLPMAVHNWLVFDLATRDVAVLTALAIAVGAWVTTLGVLSADPYLRPLRVPLARAMRDEALESSRPAVSIRARITVSLPLISVLTGAVVATAATLGDADLDELARLLLLTTAISFTSGGLLTVLFAHSLVKPLRDLLTVASRVDEGDLSARADVTTDDEFGVLALSFNAMLDERERADHHLRASRTRIIASADQERRRIERNIHDGSQQRLVALALRLRMLRDAVPTDEVLATDETFARELDAMLAEVRGARDELVQLARGLHPSTLTTVGFGPALADLVSTAPIPVHLDAPDDRHHGLAEATASTAWFIVSEAVANITKYAKANSARVRVEVVDGHLHVEVTDDGIGGASARAGSGLAGLADRVDAVGGRFEVDSPVGVGTRVRALLPLPADVMAASEAS